MRGETHADRPAKHIQPSAATLRASVTHDRLMMISDSSGCVAAFGATPIGVGSSPLRTQSAAARRYQGGEARSAATGSGSAAQLGAAPGAANARRAITVDIDRKLDKRLRVLARRQGVSQEDQLADAIEQYPKVSDQRSVTVRVSDAAAVRLAAAAASIGMSEEELIVEAIDYDSPTHTTARFWPALGIPVLLAALPLVLMFLSPAINHSGSNVARAVFASAMLACCIGAVYLISTVLCAEWLVLKFGITGLISAAACAAMAVLSAFAYLYWLLEKSETGLVQLAVVACRRDLLHPGHVYHHRHGSLHGADITGRAACQRSGHPRLGPRGCTSGLARAAGAAARKHPSNGRIIVRTEPRD
jgi:hypothetical protein